MVDCKDLQEGTYDVALRGKQGMGMGAIAAGVARVLRPTTLTELAVHHGVALSRLIETLYQYRNFSSRAILVSLESHSDG